MAIIETEAVQIPGYEKVPMRELYDSDEYGGDVSNGWFPNGPALVEMCRAAGFRRVEEMHKPRSLPEKLLWLLGLKDSKTWPKRYRAVLHAYK